MKRMSMLLMTILLVISCRKSESPANEDTVIAASKPDAKGNLHTRILNSSLDFPWEILWGPIISFGLRKEKAMSNEWIRKPGK